MLVCHGQIFLEYIRCIQTERGSTSDADPFFKRAIRGHVSRRRDKTHLCLQAVKKATIRETIINRSPFNAISYVVCYYGSSWIMSYFCIPYVRTLYAGQILLLHPVPRVKTRKIHLSLWRYMLGANCGLLSRAPIPVGYKGVTQPTTPLGIRMGSEFCNTKCRWHDFRTIRGGENTENSISSAIKIYSCILVILEHSAVASDIKFYEYGILCNLEWASTVIMFYRTLTAVAWDDAQDWGGIFLFRNRFANRSNLNVSWFS